jgi:hypothetical protein
MVGCSLENILSPHSYERILECCENSLDARPAFIELKDYFVRLYNEQLSCYEGDNHFKDILSLFKVTNCSCANALYSMPDPILEEMHEIMWG